MLVLTAKENEIIYIGEDIILRVVKIQGGSIVQLGFDAPKEIQINREKRVQNYAKFLAAKEKD